MLLPSSETTSSGMSKKEWSKDIDLETLIWSILDEENLVYPVRVIGYCFKQILVELEANKNRFGPDDQHGEIIFCFSFLPRHQKQGPPSPPILSSRDDWK